MKLSLSIICLAAVADAWDYRNVAAWPTEAPNCNASVPNQSPVNIETADPGTTTQPLLFQGIPADSAATPEIKSELVINNHTWELAWDIDDAATTEYGVQYGGKVYKLMQFHFHSPSEHTVDGQHYDMEAHMVHACYGTLTCTTQDPNDENLVVAIFMNVGDANPFLSSIWPHFATLAADSSAAHILDAVENPYTNLVPPQPHDFYRYIGSTTTPSCVPDVEWFLMSTPVTLSQEQLTTYRTAITNHANTQTLTAATAPAGLTGWDVTLGTNNRPLQPILNRLPEKYTAPVEVAQQQRDFMWHGVIIFVGLVALAVCCLLAFMQSTKPKEKKPASKRAVKPTAPKKPEEAPLVPPPAPPAVQPMLFTQPLQVPVTTFASPAPQMQFQSLAPQVRVLSP